MELPLSKDLPIENLSTVFKDTTNSYKYYWFLALLNNINQNSVMIPIDILIIDMIMNAWYPINYFKLSFGKQDQLSNSILELQMSLGYQNEIKELELLTYLTNSKNDLLVKKPIQKISRYVPYRFIAPWFTEQLRGVSDTKKNHLITVLSDQSFLESDSPSLYRILGDSVEINPRWKRYILQHIYILKGFSYWHLINYLQKNNPNVPGITEKLFPPRNRNFTNAKMFWNTYFEKKRVLRCIYSDEKLFWGECSIDHFLPWSFVAHDQLWNLIPVSKKINSSKGDNLPDQRYIEKFTEIQFDAFQTTRAFLNENILQDYSIIFNESLTNIAQFDKEKFVKILTQNIKPLMQIASNMGFCANWKWRLDKNNH